MKLDVQDTYEFDLGVNAGSTVWLSDFLAFPDGRAVALLKGGEEGSWLLEMGGARGPVTRSLPAEITREFSQYVRGNDDERTMAKDALRAFRCGELVGLLSRDKKIYLFDDIAAAPLAIELEEFPQVAPFYNDAKRMSYTIVACGSSATNLVPVMLRHPDDSTYCGHLAFLDIDIQEKKASWSADEQGMPMPVKFREHPYSLDERGNKGSLIHDLAWTGERLLVFSIGARDGYFRCGMTYSVLLDTDEHAGTPREIFEWDENVFGKICADLDRLIVTPLYKNGKRKGKQTLFDIASKTEETLELPRGHAKFTLLDMSGQTGWLTPNTVPAPFYRDVPAKFVRCAVPGG